MRDGIEGYEKIYYCHLSWSRKIKNLLSLFCCWQSRYSRQNCKLLRRVVRVDFISTIIVLLLVAIQTNSVFDSCCYVVSKNWVIEGLVKAAFTRINAAISTLSVEYFRWRQSDIRRVYAIQFFLWKDYWWWAIIESNARVLSMDVIDSFWSNIIFINKK